MPLFDPPASIGLGRSPNLWTEPAVEDQPDRANPDERSSPGGTPKASRRGGGVRGSAGQLDLEWRQPSAGRDLFVPGKTGGRWATGARINHDELAILHRALGHRDLCLLAMLGQHHYLTTEHLEAFFFPSPRAAQQQLQKLRDLLLVMRWHHLAARPAPKDATTRAEAPHGYIRRPAVYMLTERGAAVLARSLGLDATALIRRSATAVDNTLHLSHDLAVNDLFARLVKASENLPDQGLYQWIGDDGMRAEFQDREADPSPDGWGRYLVGDVAIAFHLEGDENTEPGPRIARKAATYVKHYAASVSARKANVLWVAPTSNREQKIRTELEKALERASSGIRFWTTHAEVIAANGVLGRVWWPADGNGGRSRALLADLTTQARGPYAIADCLGKPGWWNRRPGGGESS